MALQKMRFYLAHGVKHHTDGDQHTCTTEEDGYPHGNVGLKQQYIRENRDNGQKDRAR